MLMDWFHQCFIYSCEPVDGYLTVSGDCDLDTYVNPAADETCYDGSITMVMANDDSPQLMRHYTSVTRMGMAMVTLNRSCHAISPADHPKRYGL